MTDTDRCTWPSCDGKQEFPEGPSPHCLDHSLHQFFWVRPLAEFGPIEVVDA